MERDAAPRLETAPSTTDCGFIVVHDAAAGIAGSGTADPVPAVARAGNATPSSEWNQPSLPAGADCVTAPAGIHPTSALPSLTHASQRMSWRASCGADRFQSSPPGASPPLCHTALARHSSWGCPSDTPATASVPRVPTVLPSRERSVSDDVFNVVSGRVGRGSGEPVRRVGWACGAGRGVGAVPHFHIDSNDCGHPGRVAPTRTAARPVALSADAACTVEVDVVKRQPSWRRHALVMPPLAVQTPHVSRGDSLLTAGTLSESPFAPTAPTLRKPRSFSSGTGVEGIDGMEIIAGAWAASAACPPGEPRSSSSGSRPSLSGTSPLVARRGLRRVGRIVSDPQQVLQASAQCQATSPGLPRPRSMVDGHREMRQHGRSASPYRPSSDCGSSVSFGGVDTESDTDGSVAGEQEVLDGLQLPRGGVLASVGGAAGGSGGDDDGQNGVQRRDVVVLPAWRPLHVTVGVPPSLAAPSGSKIVELAAGSPLAHMRAAARAAMSAASEAGTVDGGGSPRHGASAAQSSTTTTWPDLSRSCEEPRPNAEHEVRVGVAVWRSGGIIILRVDGIGWWSWLRL